MPRLPSTKDNLNLRTDQFAKGNIGTSTMVTDQQEARVLGIPGKDGTSGTGGDLNYTHIQGVADTIWNINHNLGKYPSVTVLDSALNEVIGDVQFVDINNIILTFSATFSGTATLN